MVYGVEFEEEDIDYNKSRPIKFVNSANQKSAVNSVNPLNTQNTVSTTNSAMYNYVKTLKSNEKGMIPWLMRKGLAKSTTITQKILFCVIIINIIITILVILIL